MQIDGGEIAPLIIESIRHSNRAFEVGTFCICHHKKLGECMMMAFICNGINYKKTI